MKMKSRKGSALLIVLGMLAIMIASAVGFAAYMRFSRLPSSYLRRSASSRQLVKAALARAIDEIDLAVNNNPHPGVGTLTASRHPLGSASNVWIDRVYMGSGSCSNNTSSAVSPLCLEALAYIPPPLVDPVRYYSRLTNTACWQSLGFDAGRYAWVAVDVSDYFDVNRLVADAPRTSAANRRITLSYLCENRDHTKDSFASKWDKFMEKYRGQPDEDTGEFDLKSRYPLNSVADLNLALYDAGTVGSGKEAFKSFFCDCVEGGSSTFGSTGDETSDEFLDRMAFVTDGLFPAVSSETVNSNGETVYDLNDGKYQPFVGKDLDTDAGKAPSPASLLTGELMTQVSRFEDWRNRLSLMGEIMLFDYLDTDHRPASLALPVAERVPMICAMRPQFAGGKFAIKRESPEGDKDDDVNVVSEGKNTRVVEKTVKYRIDPSALAPAIEQGSVRTVVAFPFAHEDASDGSFKLDGRFSLFFSTEQMGLRTGNADDVLHLKNKELGQSGIDPDSGLISVVLDAQAMQFKSITDEASAVKEFECQLGRQGATVLNSLTRDGLELLTVTYRWTQTRDSAGGVFTSTYSPSFSDVWQNPARADSIEVKTGFKAVKANGSVSDELTDAKLAEYVRSGPANGPDVRLNAAVWLRVTDGEGTVDMVPACLNDDAVQNSATLGPLAGGNNPISPTFCGTPFPLFRFDTGVNFKLSVESLNSLAGDGQTITLSPEGAMVADPRFNHAPEQWYSWTGNLTKDVWLSNNHSTDADRDGDIFMATSDAGYMQSVYELAMLPAISNLRSVNDARIGNLQSLSGTSLTSIPASFENALNSRFAWRTYDPFDTDSDAFDDFPRTSAGNGFKVNPYSDSTNILMAAFANTPIDWMHASTNIVEGEEFDPNQTASEFNKKYAFNEYAPDGLQFAWDDLSRIASNFSVAARNSSNWRTAWRSLDWWGDSEHFCDVKLESPTGDLWSTDRKFLYGFWKDCFAAKQQLFLVFVRAEPTMMGGDGAGQLPPQLGAKAVALVWRDPTAAKEANYPHQTRILFYRQFD